MSVTFTRERIEAIAALAHLRLDEEEIALYARQLGDILEYALDGEAIDPDPFGQALRPRGA